MLQYHQLEALIYERQLQWQKEIERERLLRTLPPRAPQRQRLTAHVACWLGAKLVQWGLRLQGERRQPSVARTHLGTASIDCH
jgi:hypothetical protein